MGFSIFSLNILLEHYLSYIDIYGWTIKSIFGFYFFILKIGYRGDLDVISSKYNYDRNINIPVLNIKMFFMKKFYKAIKTSQIQWMNILLNYALL
jgi:hypothetical protein